MQDSQQDRQDFVKICSSRFTAGHHNLIAHDNGNGSPGVKDEKIIDKDVVAKLKKEKTYQKSKQVANFNKPENTKWKKHKEKVSNFGLPVCIGLGLLLGGASAICMATGVLSPLGLAGGAASTYYLGSAALATGWAVNISAPTISLLGLFGISYGIAEGRERWNDSNNTFNAQIKAFKKKKPKNTTTLATLPSRGESNPLNALRRINNEEMKIVLLQEEQSTPGNKTTGTAQTPQQLIIDNFIIPFCEANLDTQGSIKQYPPELQKNPENLVETPEGSRSDPDNIKAFVFLCIEAKIESVLATDTQKPQTKLYAPLWTAENKAAIASQRHNVENWVNAYLIQKYGAQFNPTHQPRPTSE